MNLQQYFLSRWPLLQHTACKSMMCWLRALDCLCRQVLCGLTNLHHLTLAIGTESDFGASLQGIPAAVSQLQLLRSLRLTGHTHMHMDTHSDMGVLSRELFLLGRWVSWLSTAPRQLAMDYQSVPMSYTDVQRCQPPCLQADQARLEQQSH